MGAIDERAVGWRGRTPTILSAVGVWLVGMAVLYREVVSSGFRTLHGDVGDQRLLVYISEHWYLVLKGHAAWRDPSYFFPAEGVLGYTESIVLYQPIYIPLRVLGLDQFVAFQLTLMALSTIGFASMLVFLCRFVGVRFPVALAGAFVFAFANNVIIKIGHGQMTALQLVPVVLLLGGGAFRAAGRGRAGRAAALGAAGGLMFALMFFTSFYVAWFGAVSGALVAVALIIVDLPLARRVWTSARAHGRAALSGIGAATVGFVVGIIPFLVTYLPVMDASGGRPFAEVISLSPRAGDLLNLGRANVAWGWLLEDFPGPNVNGERSLALTPVLVLSAIVISIVLLVWRSTDIRGTRVRAAVALLLAAAVLTLLSLRFGEWTAWKAIWSLAPGAKAIRAVDRVQLVAGILVVVAWSLVVDELWRVLRNRVRAERVRWVGAAMSVLLVFVAFEQVNSSTFVHLDRESEVAKLASVPPSPSRCSSFYVVAPPPGVPFFQAQIDAMLISHQVGLPTLNGYSGVAPPGWGLFDPAAAGYQAAVDAWVASQPVPESVCRFDLGTWSWSGV